MNIPEAPKGTAGINRDTVHLLALKDQLEQTIRWASAAQATVQSLLNKRMPDPPAPTMAASAVPQAITPPETPTPTTQPASASKGTKAALLAEALAAGIPKDLLLGPDYLNAHGRPTHAGIARTAALVESVVKARLEGRDPSSLWTAGS